MVRAPRRQSNGEFFSYVDLKARVRVIIRCGRSGTIVKEALPWSASSPHSIR